MAGVSLECRDCGAQLRSVEEAQEHAELKGHTNFAESTTRVLNLICTTCGKPCRSHIETDLHTKRTGHAQFADKTSEAAKPVVLESRPAAGEDEAMADAEGQKAKEELVVPEVNKDLLAELEGMGFPVARATRALYCSKGGSVEEAVNWIVEHEDDPDIDELPKVAARKAEPPKPTLTPEEAKAKAQALVEKARRKKEEEEKRAEREREKERIRIGKELLEAKRIEEDNDRKRIIALRKAEKEEEKRAREKIRQKLGEDKAERRRKLGLPPEEPKAAADAVPLVVEPFEKEAKKSTLPVRPATKAEQMRDCLRSIKQTYKEDDAKVKRTFQTLLTYIGNIARLPSEEKFRKIRLTNASFQERVGNIEGGIRFLELCGFERDETGEFIILSHGKIDLILLNTAGAELNSAISNPFFGVL
ncbi:hypothetical protein O6H91_16G040200 [Diphasiastrum complanatum]|uniref:Uncharacterized protein n=1 Tax=Diphasiastrum complanatum TaxID=34168 RepID=A0ACC2BBN5_DIPCM|nr:hypothetical protein O6H91_16G040200 [Diphasiastrum complanatum]